MGRSSETISRYDRSRTYEWNLERPPRPVQIPIPPLARRWTYAGLPAGTPFGMGAGPLLSGGWILYYASLGFDVLTYKTVRSRPKACYPWPNLVPVEANQLDAPGATLRAAAEMAGSWAVSFGMPSRAPESWRADVEATRKALPTGKILSVSVVATPEDGWTAEDVARDFALCARWAVGAGADAVEANFSCPNVSTADGQMYLDPELAGAAASRIREEMGTRPLLLKIGPVRDEDLAGRLLTAVAPYAQALVMVNCIPAGVKGSGGMPLFGGATRGIAGDAIREASLAQAALFARIARERRIPVRIVGCGGVASVRDVARHLEAGVEAVQIATAAMIDPEIALRLRRELAVEVRAGIPLMRHPTT